MVTTSFAKSRVDHSEFSEAVLWPVPLWSMSMMGRLVNSFRTESHPWWSRPLPWMSANGALGDDALLMEYQRCPSFGKVTKVMIKSYHEGFEIDRWGGGGWCDCVHDWGGRVLVKVVLARGLACVFILGGPTSTSMSSLCRLDIQADLILTSVEKTNLSEFVHISQAVRP